MLQIVMAPCSPFSVTPDLMRQAAALARSYGVRLHTHLAETLDEEHFCLERFGHRPLAYAEELGWSGQDVWFAHAVFIDDAEIERMAGAGIGAAHCPSSNMRLASGIAPILKFLRAGVPVGLGVDGSASNDSSHLLAEDAAGAVAVPPRNGARPVRGIGPGDDVRPSGAGVGDSGWGGCAGPCGHRVAGARKVCRLDRAAHRCARLRRRAARSRGVGRAVRAA